MRILFSLSNKGPGPHFIRSWPLFKVQKMRDSGNASYTTCICPPPKHSAIFGRPLTNFSNHKITVNNTKPPLIWGSYMVLLPIEESATNCIQQ